MLRVVHLSSTDCIGGAALAAQRLHRALNAGGAVRSRIFVGMAERPGGEVIEFDPSGTGNRTLSRLAFRLGRRLTRRVRAYDHTPFTQDWTAFGCRPLRQLPDADVYHLHWTTDLLDFRMLPAMARRAPLVWTFHDMNPFTGGCHYDGGCGRFAASCGACPMLRSTDPHDVSHRVQERKARSLAALPDHGLHVVAPSRWMAAEARRSRLFARFESTVVPNGIDTDLYRPVDRWEVRARLGIGPAERTLLFVSDNLTEGRKGFHELTQALNRLQGTPNLRLLTLGRGAPPAIGGLACLHLGHLSDPAPIRDAYNAADAFVIPSLQDNFPNTVLEALACGTPVVGFAAGGVADAVTPDVGWLAPVGDCAALAERLGRALAAGDALRPAARERALALYRVERQAETHTALYERLVEARAPRPVAALVQ